MDPSYKRWLRWGGFLGLVAGGLIASAMTHDSIHGLWLLAWPVGLLVGLFAGHVMGLRGIERRHKEATGRDLYDEYRSRRAERPDREAE